jgi:formylmethanofuran dehydrogenase subunit E
MKRTMLPIGNAIHKPKKKETQVELLEAMWKIGFNIVTCGNCGEPFIHRTGVDELECPYCDYQEDICCFPDLIY